MNLIEKYKNWKNAEKPAPVTLKNIWAVLQSFYRRKQPSGPMPHIKEQAQWRLTRANPGCLSTDVCKCGCALSELVWSDKACEDSCFPPMMGPKTWKAYKKENNIELC